MLDVHPPHHAATTWRDFFIHIATIVVGLCIAVGLEQTVEFFQHQHQAHQMEESLRRESRENIEVARSDIETLDHWIRHYRDEMDLLQATPVQQGEVVVALTPAEVGNGLLPLSDTAWLNVAQGGGLPLLPHNLVSNYWRADNIVGEDLQQSHAFFHTLYAVRSLEHLHGNSTIYTPEERTRLVFQLIAMDGELRNLRSTMGYFITVANMTLKDERVTPASLRQTRIDRLQPLPWTFPSAQSESPKR